MQSTAPTLTEIDQIKGRIDVLDNRIQSLKTHYDGIIHGLNCTKALARLEYDVSEICEDFKDLNGTIKNFKQYPDFNKIVGALQRRLRELHRNYQEERRKYEEKKKRQRMRHYEITSEEHSEVENGPIFANHLLEIGKHSQFTHALSNVRYQDKEIQNVEAGVCELAKLFQEMNKLTKQQEELIEAIKLNNEQAVEQLEKGSTKVKKAIKHTRFRNNKKW
jgi:t-SNARE complex subunit (syntaxin)